MWNALPLPPHPLIQTTALLFKPSPLPPCKLCLSYVYTSITLINDVLGSPCRSSLDVRVSDGGSSLNLLLSETRRLTLRDAIVLEHVWGGWELAMQLAPRSKTTGISLGHHLRRHSLGVKSSFRSIRPPQRGRGTLPWPLPQNSLPLPHFQSGLLAQQHQKISVNQRIIMRHRLGRTLAQVVGIRMSQRAPYNSNLRLDFLFLLSMLRMATGSVECSSCRSGRVSS